MRPTKLYRIRQPAWFWIPAGLGVAALIGLAAAAAYVDYEYRSYSFGGTFHFLIWMGGPIMSLCAGWTFFWLWRNKTRRFPCSQYLLHVPAIVAAIVALFPVLVIAVAMAPLGDLISHAIRYCDPHTSRFDWGCAALAYVATSAVATTFMFPVTYILAFFAALPTMLILPFLVLARADRLGNGGWTGFYGPYTNPPSPRA